MKFPYCIFTVVHQGSFKYFGSFLSSLSRQTVANFELFIVNDNCDNLELERLLSSFRNIININFINYSGNLLQNRIVGLDEVKKHNYEIIIFCDSDDILSNDRVERSIAHHKNSDIVIGDLVPFVDENQIAELIGIWSSRLGNKFYFDQSFLKFQNIAGFGNSSIKSWLLSKFHFNYENPLAPDWFFFDNIMRYTDKILFSDEIITYYRQHTLNLAGISKYNYERINRIYQIKKRHYELTDFKDLERQRELKRMKSILSDSEYLNQFCQMLNSSSINFFWWEETII